MKPPTYASERGIRVGELAHEAAQVRAAWRVAESPAWLSDEAIGMYDNSPFVIARRRRILLEIDEPPLGATA